MSPGMIHILALFLGLPLAYIAICLWLSHKGKGVTERKPHMHHFATVEDMLKYRTDVLERGDRCLVASHGVTYVWSGHEWE